MQKLFPNLIFEPGKIKKKSKKSKILGMVRDALGSVGGSSLSIFTGCSKNSEKLKFRKLKIGRNPFEMRLKSYSMSVKNSIFERRNPDKYYFLVVVRLRIKMQGHPSY